VISKPAISYASIVRFIAAAGLALITGACSDDEAPSAPGIVPVRIELNLDTAYATVDDATRIRARLYGEIPEELDFVWDSGDGPERIVHSIRCDTSSFSHLYASNGIYTVRLRVLHKGTELCSASAAMIVQDYVRPSRANTMTISISGIMFQYEDSIAVAGNPGSSMLRIDSSLKVCLFGNSAGPASDMFLWRDSQYGELWQRSTAPGQSSIHSAWVWLSPDGSRILSLGVTLSESNNSADKRETMHTLVLEDIPLSSGHPGSEYVVYSAPSNRQTLPLRRCSYYSGRSVESESIRYITRLVQYIPGLDGQTTVEFRKE